MGDPAGIGPAITAKAVADFRNKADFLIIGDRWVFDKVQSLKPITGSCKFIDLHNVGHSHFEPGKVKAEYGKASIGYLDKALELLKNKQAECLVTCPISKEAVNLAGYARFSGHTEYLARRTGTGHFAMMLLNDKLRFILITRHIPLKDVPSAVSSQEIYRTVILAHRSLKELFSINNPRIAVCGLNPHASDNGILGKEEGRVIIPALKLLKKKINGIDGPLPADVAVMKASEGEYDCLIAMYHDQALIPLKISSPKSGVNLTLGLPFVRTSPLHGTAFDIAQKPKKASADSLIEAIKLAIRCSLNPKKD